MCVYTTSSFSIYLLMDVCVCVCSVAQSCLTLCHPMDCSPPGSPVHGILQARILKWIAMPSSRGSSRSWDQTCVSSVSCIGKQVLYPLVPPLRLLKNMECFTYVPSLCRDHANLLCILPTLVYVLLM